MAFCTKCGTRLIEGAEFCYKCGTKAVPNVVVASPSPQMQYAKNVTKAGTKTLIDLTCDNCGANLQVTDDREFLFCEFCGKKVWVTEDNIITTHRIIDDADIKRAEAEKEIQLQQIEERKSKNRSDNIVTVIMFVILFLMMLLIWFH